MDMLLEVQEETLNRFNTKKGETVEVVLNLKDKSPGIRCVNAFTYAMTAEECDKYKGKLRDQLVTIGVVKMRAGFSGDFRLEGTLRIDAKPKA